MQSYALLCLKNVFSFPNIATIVTSIKSVCGTFDFANTMMLLYFSGKAKVPLHDFVSAAILQHSCPIGHSLFTFLWVSFCFHFLLSFAFLQHPSDVLTPQFEPLILKNISSLPLSALLSVREPFYLCDMDHQMLPAEAQVSRQ